MNLKDLYIDFFVSKGHKQIPSAPVVPENDPSVLFNTAGMQPLIPYLMGKSHPYGTRLCDYQKCIRTNDLDVIGDTYHHTFFEMLGNWSLGDYFKEESIKMSYGLLADVLGFDMNKISVTVFAGEDGSVYQMDAPKGIVKNSVGAGDSMVAGFLAGYLKYCDYEKAFRMGVCAGSASAFSDTLATEHEVMTLFDIEVNRASIV